MQENVFSERLWKAKVRDILETYQKKVVLAIKNGYDGVEENKWTFAGAFLYSLTVITTIGESFPPFTLLRNLSRGNLVRFNSSIYFNFLVYFNFEIAPRCARP